MIKSGTKFSKHRPKDPLDPGFSLTGYKLKWMSPHKTEDRAGGIWETLHLTNVPEELKKVMKQNNLFAKGDTIRNNELVLGVCSEDVHAEMRQEKKSLAEEQLRRIKNNPHNAQGMTVTDLEMSKRSAEDAFKD